MANYVFMYVVTKIDIKPRQYKNIEEILYIGKFNLSCIIQCEAITHKLTFITYIYNWPLQPFSQDYGVAYHTTHFV